MLLKVVSKQCRVILLHLNRRLIIKIIFLDIDGVLNNEESEYYPVDNGRFGRTTELFTPRLIDNLNLLLTKTGAKIVVSSTWRLGKTVEELQLILNGMGVVGEVIDKTEDHNNGFTFRGNEIIKWVKDNKGLLGCPYYDFKSYVILDDDSDMLLWQVDNSVHTNGYKGLTLNDVYKAILILNK